MLPLKKRVYKERENQKRIKNWGQGTLSRNFVTKNKRKEEFGSRVKRQMIKITACLYDLEMPEWKNWFGQGKNACRNRGTEFTVQLGDSTETWLGIAHLGEQMDEGLKHDHLEVLRCHWKPRGHESKAQEANALQLSAIANYEEEPTSEDSYFLNLLQYLNNPINYLPLLKAFRRFLRPKLKL